VLDTIPGVGPTIRTSLLKTLGSARRVRESSVAELASVPKVTPKLAQRLHDYFHAEERTAALSPAHAEPSTRSPERDAAHVTSGGEVKRE
jgi:excinuclease ABC subunit C